MEYYKRQSEWSKFDLTEKITAVVFMTLVTFGFVIMSAIIYATHFMSFPQ